MNVSLLLTILLLCLSGVHAQTMKVISKVADVNAYPDNKERFDLRGFDSNRLSQVLNGDRIQALFVGRRWVKAEIPWMQILVQEKPAVLVGWIEKRHLQKVSDKVGPARVKRKIKDVRKSIVSMAREYEDFPYLWGGRSQYDRDSKRQKTSVDCSGFVSLVYQLNGIVIPRNSRTQYLSCKKIKYGSQLHPGDLIFLSKNKFLEGIDHVIIYLGSGLIIAAVHKEHYWKFGETPINRVVLRADVSYFGKKIPKLASGDSVCDGRGHIFFGSFL